MKKVLKLTAVIVVFAMLFGLCSCGGEEDQAQKSAQKMFDLLKEGDYTGAREYIATVEGTNDFLGCGDEFNEESFSEYAMHKAVFESIDYKFKKTVGNEPVKVTFVAEVTTLDMAPVAEELFVATEEYNFMAENNEAEFTEEDINKALTQQMKDISNDYINSTDKKTRTTELTINVCYEDRAWRVYPDEALVDVLTGGVYTRYNELMQEYLADDER